MTFKVFQLADEVAVEHGKEIARMNRMLSDKDRQLRRLQTEYADHKADSELLSSAQRQLEGLTAPPSKSSDS